MSVELARSGHVAHVVFRNPPHNYATIELLRAIGDVLEQLDADPECRAVVLASEGKSFCAGADLVSEGGMGASADDPILEFYDQALRLFTFGKPIVAADSGRSYRCRAGAGGGRRLSHCGSRSTLLG